MIADSRTSVAFTGHRTYRGAAADALRRTVGELYARGFRNFLSGMAVGFDLAAAEAVLELRERAPGVRLVAAVPFRGLGRGLEVVNLCPAAPVPPAPEPTLFG